MKGYEHEIKGTVMVSASDPEVNGNARYMIVKVVHGDVWYFASTNDLKRAEQIKENNSKYAPTFIIDRETL